MMVEPARELFGITGEALEAAKSEDEDTCCEVREFGCRQCWTWSR